jgi:hypothetical protein
METLNPPYKSPAFLYGQALATREMCLALADILDTRAVFIELATERLETLRNTILQNPIEDEALLAIDHAAGWLSGLDAG